MQLFTLYSTINKRTTGMYDLVGINCS